MEFESIMLLIRNLLNIVAETRKMGVFMHGIFLTVLQRPEIVWM